MGSSNKPMRGTQQSTTMKSNFQELEAKIQGVLGEHFRNFPLASTLETNKTNGNKPGKVIRVGAYRSGPGSPSVWSLLSKKDSAEYCSPATDISFVTVRRGTTATIPDDQLQTIAKSFPFTHGSPKALKFLIAFYYLELGLIPGLIYDLQSFQEFVEVCKNVVIDARGLDIQPLREMRKSILSSESNGIEKPPRTRQEKRQVTEFFRAPVLNTKNSMISVKPEDTPSTQDSSENEAAKKARNMVNRRKRVNHVVDLSDDESSEEITSSEGAQIQSSPPSKRESNSPTKDDRKRAASSDDLDGVSRKKSKTDDFIEHCLKGAQEFLARERIESEAHHTQVRNLEEEKSRLQSELGAQIEEYKKTIESKNNQINKLEEEIKRRDGELAHLRSFKDHVLDYKFPE